MRYTFRARAINNTPTVHNYKIFYSKEVNLKI